MLRVSKGIERGGFFTAKIAKLRENQSVWNGSPITVGLAMGRTYRIQVSVYSVCSVDDHPQARRSGRFGSSGKSSISKHQFSNGSVMMPERRCRSREVGRLPRVARKAVASHRTPNFPLRALRPSVVNPVATTIFIPCILSVLWFPPLRIVAFRGLGGVRGRDSTFPAVSPKAVSPHLRRSATALKIGFWWGGRFVGFAWNSRN